MHGKMLKITILEFYSVSEMDEVTSERVLTVMMMWYYLY